MYIHEAVEKAVKENGKIIRSSAEHLQRLRVTSPETKMHESILRKRNILHETVKHCHHGAQGIPYRADTEQS